jgi:hypothetical protein
MNRRVFEDSQLRSELEELLGDIAHVNAISEREVTRILANLRQRISETSLSEAAEVALMQEVSSELAWLAARVALAEKAVGNLRKQLSGVSDTANAPAVLVGRVRDGLVHFSARQLAEGKNLWPLETAPDGRDFCWTGPAPETQFNLAVDRSAPLVLQILVYAWLKPRYAKHVKISVDGKPLRHRVSGEGSLSILSCTLPAMGSHPLTQVSVSMPGMHSPTELGLGRDERTLGMAIHEIRCLEPSGVLSRLKRSFRSKSSAPIECELGKTRLSEGVPQTDQHERFTSMNAHLAVGNLLAEIDREIERQKGSPSA